MSKRKLFRPPLWLSTIRSCLVQQIEHAAVKRYGSTGDMVINFTSHPPGGATPARTRHLRPKSEGGFCYDGIRAKRASSFGVINGLLFNII